jgi:hypothetical protein
MRKVELRVHIRLPFDPSIEAAILYDFSGYSAFLACYIPGEDHPLGYYIFLLRSLSYGATPLTLAGNIKLPRGRDFPGAIQVENVPGRFELFVHFFGDSGWFSSRNMRMSTRVFIYTECDLTEDEVSTVKLEGLVAGHEVQFRSNRHALERSKFETPLAFISHDSRDDEVAREIAVNLQKMGCPVWYDRFSLKVGDNLRDSIERGLKECRKCVILLSSHFFSNRGWTKREFDSIFTREILEEQQLVLPVWYEVNKTEVFDYSPSLLNVKGIDWGLGVDEVSRQLYLAIEGANTGSNGPRTPPNV